MISPVYFIHGGKWHVVSGQKTDVDAVMRNHLEFDSGKDIMEGALMYRIRRKHTEYYKSKYIQLLVAWRIEHEKGLHVHALLIGHDGKLDKNRLRRLHKNIGIHLVHGLTLSKAIGY
jgi:hypothetical protein